MDDTAYCQVVDLPIDEVAVPNYTDEEHGTWKLLLHTQESLIEGRASRAFIDGLRAVDFPKDRIPKLRDISQRIHSHTGWKLLRVDGLVHPVDFFELLAKKVFPSTDFIRKRSELMYTPAPDMFHDLFGHSPLLTNPAYTRFFENFGKVGVKASKKYAEDHEIHKMLPRIYWFTVEFGLTKTNDGLRAYGSGSVSSPEELQFCVSEKSRKHPFDIEVVSRRDYDIWRVQEDVFVIESFQALNDSFEAWATKYGIHPAV